MNYGRIRRGPMAGDAFTQIRNLLFRDPHLSFRDKGIFGLISTHRDGFGVTAESIAACSPTDGVSAVKTSLRALEKYGYLQRTRERRKDGTLGVAVYYITDQPEIFGGDPEVESGRSEPAVPQPTLAGPAQAQPPVVQPALAEPALADHLHKKTIPIQEDQLEEDEISLPAVPAQRAEPEPEHERETSASPKLSTAQQVLRAAGLVESSEEEAFISWAADYYRIRSSALWRTVAANGDLTDWVTTWRSQAATGGAQPLPGTDTTVSGWMDLARQLREPEHGRQHTPYSNSVWDRLAQQAAAGERPDGWERYRHCGHPDCDETTRMRDGSYCSGCHPALQF